MPQNTKHSKGGKDKPVKDSVANGVANAQTKDRPTTSLAPLLARKIMEKRELLPKGRD